MSASGELLRRQLFEVFNQPDAAEREAVVAELYTDDVAFHDPEGSVQGRAALAEKVTALLAQGPGLTFRLVGEPRAVADLATVDWELAPGDGPAVLKGTDVALIRDNRIAILYTLVG